MSKIEAEVLDATGVNPKKGESRADFLDRLVNYLDDNKKFTDADYNKLSDPAQKWANAACTALGKREPVPEFPDAEKAKDDKGSKADEVDKGSSKSGSAEEEEVVAKKKATAGAKDGKDDKKGVAKTGDLKKAAPAPKGDDKKPAPAKDKAEKAPAKAKAEKKAKPEKVVKEKKAGGKSADLKKLILAKPERTNAELMEMMKKKGHEITLSTLSTIRSGFLHSMQVIIDEGRLKDAK